MWVSAARGHSAGFTCEARRKAGFVVRFEFGALRPTRSTLRASLSRSRAQARFTCEARRKAGFVFPDHYVVTVTATRCTALLA